MARKNICLNRLKNGAAVGLKIISEENHFRLNRLKNGAAVGRQRRAMTITVVCLNRLKNGAAVGPTSKRRTKPPSSQSPEERRSCRTNQVINGVPVVLSQSPEERRSCRTYRILISTVSHRLNRLKNGAAVGLLTPFLHNDFKELRRL